MKLGITGTRNGFANQQEKAFINLLDELTNSDSTIPIEFHHGDCVGVDVQAAQIIYELFASAIIVCHPPIKGQLRGHFRHNTVMLPEKNYLARNRDIVHASELLIGCPSTAQPTQSGTWYTIRYGKQNLGKENVKIVNPYGKVI